MQKTETERCVCYSSASVMVAIISLIWWEQWMIYVESLQCRCSYRVPHTHISFFWLESKAKIQSKTERTGRTAWSGGGEPNINEKRRERDCSFTATSNCKEDNHYWKERETTRKIERKRWKVSDRGENEKTGVLVVVITAVALCCFPYVRVARFAWLFNYIHNAHLQLI